MDDEAGQDEDVERIVRMLLDAGLVEEQPLDDGRIALGLTDRGRALRAVLPELEGVLVVPDADSPDGDPPDSAA